MKIKFTFTMHIIKEKFRQMMEHLRKSYNKRVIKELQLTVILFFVNVF